MIKITLIAMGKLKERYLLDAFMEYKKRLSRYADFSLVEIDPVRLSETPSQNEINSALEKEAEMIMKKTPQNTKVISLCVEGKGMTSEKFSDLVGECSNMGRGITFIIGS